MLPKLAVEVCIPAYNEEKNIAHILDAYLRQHLHRISIDKIVVVSSGSTDTTNEIVRTYADKYPQIKLIIEPERKGKASAINLFLQQAVTDYVVLQSADTIPLESTIEKLCLPFLSEQKLGMTGGAPYPVNKKDTFTGYVVHTWWWFHRHIPRFGELIAFKTVIKKIPVTSSVDEAYIQAKFIQMGYSVRHIDDAVIYNKGSETVKDIIKQRRRILNGHVRLFLEEGIRIQNMTKSGLYLLFFKYKINSIRELMWLIGGLFIEVWVNILGRYDLYIKRNNPYIWDIAGSTKHLQNRKSSDVVLSVTVGIPTYNSAENIVSILKAICSQRQYTFHLHTIVVYSDCSTDATVEKANEIDDPRVRVITASARGGFASGVSYLSKHFSHHYLVILNDDILIEDELFLEKLLRPFLYNPHTGMVCGNPQPLKPRTLVERALVTRLKASEDLAKRLHNGSNIFACDGKVMVLHPQLIAQIHFPHDLRLMGNVDAFLYFSCLTALMKYETVYDAVVYYRNPSSIGDYVKWIVRNNKNRQLLERQFDRRLVTREYSKPSLLLMRTLCSRFLHDPLSAFIIVLLEIHVYFESIKKEQFNPTWDLLLTSKKL